MDIEKLLKWKELAQNYYGKDFWSGIFDQEDVNKMAPNFSEMFDKGKKEDFPKYDIWMNRHEIIVLIELPGLNKDEINLTVNGNKLSIQGEFKSKYNEYSNVTRERSYGSFERTISLPEFVKKNQAKAKFHNGELEIKFKRIIEVELEKIKIE